MSELVFLPDCFTYAPVPCYVCNTVIPPDDQEVVLSGRRYVCVCVACATALARGKELVCLRSCSFS